MVEENKSNPPFYSTKIKMIYGYLSNLKLINTYSMKNVSIDTNFIVFLVYLVYNLIII